MEWWKIIVESRFFLNEWPTLVQLHHIIINVIKSTNLSIRRHAGDA
jgi:hypothetical protein